MADTFTSLLRLVLQETGGNQNVWGGINNASLVQLLEIAVAGRVDVGVTGGDVVLTTANGATDQARNAMLAITGNPGVARTVTVPSTSKLYMVSNETSPGFDVTIKTAAGTGVVIPSGSVVMVYVDPSADETFIIGSTALQATESVSGIAELATQAETDAGSDDTRIVTPFKLANATSLLQATETQKGALEIATQVETDAGSDDVRAITPAKLAGRVTSETLAGIIELATQAEVDAGTDPVRAVTPATLGAIAAGGFSHAAEKTVDQSTNTDVTLDDDDDLVLTGIIAGTYNLTMFIAYQATVDDTMGIKWRINYTGSVTRSLLAAMETETGANTRTLRSVNVTVTNTQIDVAVANWMLMSGTIVVSDTGTLSFQWAQAASRANNLNVLKSSFLALQKIA